MKSKLKFYRDIAILLAIVAAIYFIKREYAPTDITPADAIMSIFGAK